MGITNEQLEQINKGSMKLEQLTTPFEDLQTGSTILIDATNITPKAGQVFALEHEGAIKLERVKDSNLEHGIKLLGQVIKATVRRGID